LPTYILKLAKTLGCFHHIGKELCRIDLDKNALGDIWAIFSQTYLVTQVTGDDGYVKEESMSNSSFTLVEVSIPFLNYTCPKG
jgi:hypothetical protein